MKAAIGALAAASLLVLGGCGTTEDPAPTPECSDSNMLGDTCVGVPPGGSVCDDEVCAANVQCTNSIIVGTDAELGAALGSANPGDCVLLKAGVYGQAILPGGVSLLGKGADFVEIGFVEIGTGSNATVQGFSVAGSGIRVLDGATGVSVNAVRVTATDGDGITVGIGSSVTVNESEIHGAARYAISAFQTGDINVEASVLNGAQGPGLWAQCSVQQEPAIPGCDCAGQSGVVSISDTIIRDTKLVGLSLVGVQAALTNVEISGNTVDDHFQPGGGMSVSACSAVQASGLYVLDNTNFGVLVDDSSVTFGDAGDINIEVSRNLRGMWIQNIGQSQPGQTVELRGAELLENTGVGLGIDGESTLVTVESSSIRQTALVALPVLVDGVSAGAQEVGDGFNWFSSSQISVNGLTVSDSARASVLIDGDVGQGSSIDNVMLEGADAALGILQQNFPDGGVSPTVGPGAPVVNTDPSQVYPIAERLGLPPGI